MTTSHTVQVHEHYRPLQHSRSLDAWSKLAVILKQPTISFWGLVSCHCELLLFSAWLSFWLQRITYALLWHLCPEYYNVKLNTNRVGEGKSIKPAVVGNLKPRHFPLATSALSLSYDKQTTTSPEQFSMYCHWMTHLYTQQPPLRICCKKFVRSQPESSIYQETEPILGGFSHSKCLKTCCLRKAGALGLISCNC